MQKHLTLQKKKKKRKQHFDKVKEKNIKLLIKSYPKKNILLHKLI